MFTVFRKGKPADRHAGLQVVPQQSPQGRGWEPEPCSEPGAGAAPGCGEAVLLHPKLGTSLFFTFFQWERHTVEFHHVLCSSHRVTSEEQLLLLVTAEGKGGHTRRR